MLDLDKSKAAYFTEYKKPQSKINFIIIKLSFKKGFFLRVSNSFSESTKVMSNIKNAYQKTQTITKLLLPNCVLFQNKRYYNTILVHSIIKT